MNFNCTLFFSPKQEILNYRSLDLWVQSFRTFPEIFTYRTISNQQRHEPHHGVQDHKKIIIVTSLNNYLIKNKM